MKWLFENLSTIIIFAVLAAVIVLIIKSIKTKKAENPPVAAIAQAAR